eukprot:scaffold89731_cov27-Phaeocystis_antarctica.AAC.1
MLRSPYTYVEAVAAPRDASISRGALSREDQPHTVVLGRQRLGRGMHGRRTRPRAAAGGGARAGRGRAGG